MAQNADINMLRSISLHRNAALGGIMITVSNSVYPVSAAIPLTELIVGYAEHDSKTIRNGWQSVGGDVLTGILTLGIKYGVNRARPYVTYPYLQPYQYDNDPSFPSGHTAFSFNTATSLSLCYPHWYVIAPSFLWASTVGYSRMYLGMHYPTDVLTGAVTGAGSAWLAYKGNRWLQRRKKKNEH